MSDNGRQVPWIDGARYNRNRNQFPADELEHFAGQYVAFNAEGTRILGHGADHIAVETMLRSLGIDPSMVVFERIPELWEDTWL